MGLLGCGLFFSPANAASDNSQPAVAPPGNSTWGAGPIMLTLLDVARHEAPLRGVDPALKSHGAGEPVLAADALPSAPARSIPLPYQALANR